MAPGFVEVDVFTLNSVSRQMVKSVKEILSYKNRSKNKLVSYIATVNNTLKMLADRLERKVRKSPVIMYQELKNFSLTFDCS